LRPPPILTFLHILYISIFLFRRSFRSKKRPSYVDTTSACLFVFLSVCLSVCQSHRIIDWTIGRIAIKLSYIYLCGKYEFRKSCLRNTLPKWVCACTFHISSPVRMKFGTVYFHIMISISSQFDGSRRSEICTPL